MANGKRVVLTMQQRLDVLKDLETSSILSITRKYNVHHTTIRRIKEKATIIAEFAEKSNMEQSRKTLRRPIYKDLEQRLIKWFIERRTVGDIVSDRILIKKAAELKEEVAGCSNFKMSKGWLIKFKRRHGIRLVRICNKKASANENSAKNSRDEEQDEERDGERGEEMDAERGEEMDAERGEEMDAERGEEMDAERGEVDAERGEVDAERGEELDGERGEEMDGERGKEVDEGRDEELAVHDGTREQGMKWNSQDREELEDIFSRLQRFQNRLPRAAQLHMEGLKLQILGDIDQKK